MPDETYRLEIQDNLADVKARADSAKQAVEGLADTMRKTGTGGHTFPEPGQYINPNEVAGGYEKISAAQDRWALSTMNHTERIQYLNTKVSQTVEGTDAWYNAQAQLNRELNSSDDSLKQIARNFSPLIGSGRALAELGRAGSIFGQLIGDDDVKRTSQLAVAMGELVMVVGRLPQVATAIGVSMTGLAGIGAGIAAIAALSAAQNKTAARTAAGPWEFAVESGAQAGAETRRWLKSIGVELPDLGEALNKATNGTNKLDFSANSAAQALLSLNNVIYDTKQKMEKMTEGQLKVTSVLYAGLDKGAGGVLGMFGIKTPYSELSDYAGTQAGVAREKATPLGQLRAALSEGNTGAINQMFPTNAMDLTKYTQDEITRAKQMSVQATNSELDALRQQATALGLSKDEVEKLVALRREEIDAMVQLITLQGKASYLTGAEANHLSEMLGEIQTTKKQESSSFNFQRLSNVDSSQFGQLQALTAMYNQMLTNLGSPEKNESINLLLGDNTFRTMNTRMTALQLALEDLTKVEKAQLSGTWNLPAGATALVPITSLDLQRWNKPEGGMPDLSKLLSATNQSGDKVSTSQQVAASRIIAAIRENAIKAGLPTEKIEQAKTPTEAIAAVASEIRGVLATREAELRQPLQNLQSLLRPKMEFEDTMIARYTRPTDSRNTTVPYNPEVSVNISALPIKAALTAQVNVLLNGSVIARALMPLMFDMLAKLQAGSGYRQQGVSR